MPGTHTARSCVLCGAPLPPRAKAYCAACALKRAKQRAAEKNARRKQRRQAARAAMQKKPAPPAAAGSWTDADVVRCVGCKYWRPLCCLTPACHYAIDTGRLRLCRPRDCYGRTGTPYTPR